MDKHACRACRGSAGHLVLDLGEQPACDYFPPLDDPGPDPVYPLQMWLCSSCGLAQLLTDPTVPEEPRGTEPAALVAQAADAVARVAAAGWLPERSVVAEYGSPHGGSWLGLLAARGLVPADHGEPGRRDRRLLRHDARGGPARGARRARGPDSAGRSAAAAVSRAQHDHRRRAVERAPARALRVLLDDRADRDAGRGRLQPAHRLAVRVCTAAPCCSPRPGTATEVPDPTTRSGRCWPTTRASASAIPAPSAGLQQDIQAHAKTLHDWLAAERSAGKTVLGYGAASRAVALLCQAHVDRDLLPAVIDASPAKQGLRMPGTDIPVAGPGRTGRAPPGRGAAVRPGSAGRGPGRLSRSGNRRWPVGRCRDARLMMPAAGRGAGPGIVPGWGRCSRREGPAHWICRRKTPADRP